MLLDIAKNNKLFLDFNSVIPEKWVCILQTIFKLLFWLLAPKSFINLIWSFFVVSLFLLVEKMINLFLMDLEIKLTEYPL